MARRITHTQVYIPDMEELKKQYKAVLEKLSERQIKKKQEQVIQIF